MTAGAMEGPQADGRERRGAWGHVVVSEPAADKWLSAPSSREVSLCPLLLWAFVLPPPQVLAELDTCLGMVPFQQLLSTCHGGGGRAGGPNPRSLHLRSEDTESRRVRAADTSVSGANGPHVRTSRNVADARLPLPVGSGWPTGPRAESERRRGHGSPGGTRGPRRSGVTTFLPVTPRAAAAQGEAPEPVQPARGEAADLPAPAPYRGPSRVPAALQGALQH